MSQLSGIETLRRQSLTLKEKTWRTYDKYYLQLEQYLKKQSVAMSEESLLSWVMNLKSNGAAPSTINKMFAAVVTVLECKNGDRPPGVKFVKTRIKKWLNKSVPKKSLSFSYSEVVAILSSCDLHNLRYVATCTSLIIGVFGLHRISEIKAYTTKMLRKDEDGRGYWCESTVGSKTTAAGQLTRFHVPNEMKHSNMTARPRAIIDAHLKALRTNLGDDYGGNLFQTVRNNAFIKMPMGINTLSRQPRRCAEHIGRKDANLFSGHAFRRTGARILADMGATRREIQRAGRWKDPNICEGYIDESDLTALNTSNLISGKARMTSVLQAPKEIPDDAPRAAAKKSSSFRPASTGFKPPRRIANPESA